MTGVRPLSVGGSMFLIPDRATVVRTRDAEVALVLEPSGKVTALLPSGDLQIPPERQAEIREHYFPGAKKIPHGT